MTCRDVILPQRLAIVRNSFLWSVFIRVAKTARAYKEIVFYHPYKQLCRIFFTMLIFFHYANIFFLGLHTGDENDVSVTSFSMSFSNCEKQLLMEAISSLVPSELITTAYKDTFWVTCYELKRNWKFVKNQHSEKKLA